MYSGSSYTSLDVPGASLTGAWGINDLGQIVGSYIDRQGNQRGFLATPVPEASSLMLLCIATLGLSALLRRRRKQVEG